MCHSFSRNTNRKNTEYFPNQNFRNILTEANKDAKDFNVEANFPPIQTACSRRKPKMYYELRNEVIVVPKLKVIFFAKF